MREPPRRRAMPSAVAFVVTAAVVVVVVAWSMLARARAGAEPLPHVVSAPSEAAVVTESAPAPAVVAAATAVETRTAANEANGVIRGVVHDETGAPVPGWRVQLAFSAAQPKTLDEAFDMNIGSWTRTSSDGAFAFPGLAPGRWIVYASGRLGGMDLRLSAGEVRDVDLRIDGTGTVVTFRITSFGVVSEGVQVRAIENEADELTVSSLRAFAISDSNGDAAMFLPPGVHRLEIRDVVRVVDPRREWTVRRTITVPPNVRTYHWAIDVPRTLVAMAFVGAPAPSDLVFVVDGRFDDDPEELHAEVKAVDGRAELRLPAGRFRIGLRARGFVEAVARDAVTGLAQRLDVEVAGSPAAAVVLELRRQDGRRFTLPQHSAAMLARLPDLVVGERRFTATPQGDDEGVFAGTAPLSFQHVPLGSGMLSANDRVSNEGAVFLPFDPIESRAVDVTTGDNRVDVIVEPRAFVELIGCTSSGMQDTRSIVRVFANDTLVSPVCSPEQSRWQGFLPPGEYRAVVQRGEVSTETRLNVQRAPIALRLKP